MAGWLQPLSNECLMEIARYFAALELPYVAPSVAPPMAPVPLARGRTLALEGDPAWQLPACARCHGEALTGRQPACLACRAMTSRPSLALGRQGSGVAARRTA